MQGVTLSKEDSLKAELQRLYSTHQKQFGYEGRELVFACEVAEAKAKARTKEREAGS